MGVESHRIFAQSALSSGNKGILKRFSKMEYFFKVKKPDEVFEIIDQFGPSGEETTTLEDALGRVVSRNVISPEDLPGFLRSTVDGYAVRAKDTFGAAESLPALFEISGEALMGESPGIEVGPGQAAKISTGGMLPQGADGVVMVEYCDLLDKESLEVGRAVSPLENVIQPGDDFRKGACVLKMGHKLRAQELGVLAGLGISEDSVFRRPKVGIISTGDEIVPIDTAPLPGKVRDINSYSLGACCRRMGAETEHLGLCPDDFDSLRNMVASGLGRADTIWISGGSSVGTRDLTLKVFETLPDFELLVHGISISPGKPTIIGRAGSQAVIGLPGHVASALVVAEIFLTRLIERLSGLKDFSRVFRGSVEAELSRNIESASGREDYIRVKLVKKEETLIAEPVFGKSGLISTLVEADGLIRIDVNTEGLYQGQRVQVLLLAS
ncbi:MAG: molybdopterin molybdotransferase MoeA [Thermodesulfobacteriota bacterium]|nr:molybdopterin molybdotransferase MoeA [Thermodesulfobacteriota bacterium]